MEHQETLGGYHNTSVSHDSYVDQQTSSLIIHGDKNSVYEGRLICGNLKWNKDKTKDGVLSSSISFVSMLVVGLLFIMFV